jgi:hypothetical protein
LVHGTGIIVDPAAPSLGRDITVAAADAAPPERVRRANPAIRPVPVGHTVDVSSKPDDSPPVSLATGLSHVDQVRSLNAMMASLEAILDAIVKARGLRFVP